MTCRIAARPKPGTYESSVQVSLDCQGAHRLFYVFDANLLNVNSWQSGTPVPAPERSHAACIESNKETNVIGGIHSNSALNLNDRFETDTETWSFDTELPLPLAQTSVSKSFVSCGLSDDPTNYTAEWKDHSWHTKCPAPTKTYGHNYVAAKQCHYLLNGVGNKNVFRYEPSTDTWHVDSSNLHEDHSLPAVSLDDSIYFPSGDYMAVYDPETKSFSTKFPYRSVKGSSFLCVHPNHILQAGGHSDRIMSSTSHIDLERHVQIQGPALPKNAAYAAVGSHNLYAGSGASNQNVKFVCPLAFLEYQTPIQIEKNGIVNLTVVAVDKNFNVVARENFEYEIENRLLAITLSLSPYYFVTIEWPDVFKIDGSRFSMKDIIPENLALDIAKEDGPLRRYNHEILDQFPALNSEMIAGTTYRMKLLGPNKIAIQIQAYGNPER